MNDQSDLIDTKSSIRLDAWRGVLEKTNRILSGQKVTVTIVPSSQVPGNMQDVPGWTDGVDIHLNGGQVDKMMSTKDALDAVLRLKGLNYHELCHVLFTPRMNDELPRQIMNKAQQTGDTSWWYAFNALEDQRIETWFTATYGASRRYFEATVLEWILKNGSAESAILIYGRKYLSPRIRVQAGRVFKKKYGDALFAEFQTVIDEYVTLTLPRESIRAQRLIASYHELLGKMRAASNAPLPVLVVMDNGMAGNVMGMPQRDSCDAPRKGRVIAKDAERAKARAAESIEDAIDADIEAEAEMDSEAQNGASGEGKPAQSGAAETSDDNSGTSSTGSGAGGSGAGSDSGDHSGSGTSTGDELVDAMRELKQEASQSMDEVRNDESVIEDAGRVMDAIKAIERNGEAEAKGASVRNSETFVPNDGTRQAVRKIVNIVTRIRQDAEPETLRKVHAGRVDIKRAVARQPHETDIFTVWDHGSEEETGMEAVLLVDYSGSMSHRMSEACSAMWAFKRAFDKLDIRTTVMLYDSTHLILWQPTDRASGSGIPNIRANGGTDPTSALHQAHRILSKSNAPNKVCITVTDGSWGGDKREQRKIMRSMHKHGVTSMLLGLDQAVERYGKHDHLEGHDIQHARDLNKAALKLVAQIMRNSSS